MGMLGGVVGMAGSIMGGIGQQKAAAATAEAENVNAINNYLLTEYRGKMLKFQGESYLGASQRQMEQTRLKTDYVQSAVQARAAASGAGATDATVLNVQGEIAKQGELGALTDLWEGLNKRTDTSNQARAELHQAHLFAANAHHRGQMAIAAADNAMMGGILGGLGGLIGGFGKGFG